MSKEVSYKISWMTFLANVLILLQHSHIRSIMPDDKVDDSLILMDFFSNISLPMMSWFFFVTAYLFFRKVSNYTIILVKLKKRLYSLGVPYLIWNTVGLVVHIIGGEYSKGTSVWRIVRCTYLFYNSEGCGNVPLWYIFRIFTFLIFSPLVYLVLNRMKKRTFVLLEFIIVVLNIVFEIGYYEFAFFLPIYLMGAYVGLNCCDVFESYLDKQGKKTSWYRVVLLFIIYIAITYVRLMINVRGEDLIYRIVSLFVIILILHTISNVKCPTDFVLGAGMYLYCSHDIVYRFVRNILLSRLSFTMAIEWMIMLLVSFAMMIVSWIFMKRFMPNVLNVLTGGRNERNY